MTTKEMVLSNEQLQEIVKNNPIKSTDDLNDVIRQMSKELIETLLKSELDNSLGYKKHDIKNKETDNCRNGFTPKKVLSKMGEIDVSVPRDRLSEFEPILVKKHNKDISGMEEKIISMYAYGMTTRDIQDHLKDIYGYEFSPETISNITDQVLESAKEWQNRTLDTIYPIIYMDALVFKVRRDGRVQNTAVYGIIGINLEGKKECLGLWIGDNESSKFWLGVLNELKNRGVEDVLIFSVDNLTGISEAIQTAYPKSDIQKCVVHQIRNSLKFVPWKERKKVAADLKEIYKASTEECALDGLTKFKEIWDKKYPHISISWERNWDELATFFKYPEEIRRIIYTTNPIESFNYGLKKNAKNRCSFPTEDALVKLLYLNVKRISKKWISPVRNWGMIYSQLSIYFKDRLEKYSK